MLFSLFIFTKEGASYLFFGTVSSHTHTQKQHDYWVSVFILNLVGNQHTQTLSYHLSLIENDAVEQLDYNRRT